LLIAVVAAIAVLPRLLARNFEDLDSVSGVTAP
jgi:hypothetical protein